MITRTGLQWISAKRLAVLTTLCGLIGVGAFCIVASNSLERAGAQGASPAAQRPAEIQPLPRLRLLRTLSAPNLHYFAANYFTMFDRSIERRIGIYSTDDWRLVTKVSFGDAPEPPQARSPQQDFIAFLDVHNVLYFWDPITKDFTKERRLDSTTTSMLFSPDGAMIAQGSGDVVNLYEVVNGSI